MLSRVSPFRDPWIEGYLHLPMAYRSLSRLSSALSAKASTLRSLQLDQMLFSKLRHIALCHLAGFVSLFYIDVTRYPRMSCYISFLQTFDTLRFLIQYSVFKVQIRNLRFRLEECSAFFRMIYFILVGLSGLEPPTSRLSGVRSNRLSYKPPKAFRFLRGILAATCFPMPSPA